MANPRYSQRAFAKFIEIAPSTMSGILNGKKGFSRSAAIKIAKKLKFDDVKSAIFCDMADLEYSRSPRKKSLAQQRLKEIKSEMFQTLEVDIFQYVSDWQHWAIMERPRLKNASWDSSAIAKDLAINTELAQESLDRLLKLELLKPTSSGGFISANNTINLTSMNNAIRQLHKSVLNKAITSVEKGSVNERYVGSSFFAIEKSRYQEAVQAIQDFRRQFVEKYTAELNQGDDVYCLSVQLFAPKGEQL